MSYTDDFEAGDTYPTNDIGGNWTIFGDGNGLSIFQGNVIGLGFGRNLGIYSAQAFANDQYSEIALTFSYGAGVVVRGDSSSNGGYWAHVNNGFLSYFIYKRVSGTDTQIGGGSATTVDGDVIRLEVVGTQITFKQNGSTLDSVTDSDIASGTPGLTSADPSSRISQWEGGDIAGAAGQPTIRRFGGVPFMGGQGLGQKSGGGKMWGRTRSGLFVLRRFAA